MARFGSMTPTRVPLDIDAVPTTTTNDDDDDALSLDGLLDQSLGVDSFAMLDELEALATSSDSTSAPRPSRRRRVPQSQRVRNEQARLRDEIAALERTLAGLLAARAVAHLAAPRTAWRAVAKRQAARCDAARDQNGRLRAQLARQRARAQALEAAIRDSVRDAPYGMPPAWQPLQQDTRAGLERLLDRFMADIDVAYAAVDAVVPGENVDDDVPLFERRPSHASVKALSTDGSHAPYYGEVRQALALPFALARVNTVLWRVVSGEYARQNRELERYRYNQGAHACKVLLPLGSDGAKGTAAERESTITSFARLFVEADRTVLVWRAFRTTLRGGSFSDALCTNTGWVVFRPLKSVKDHVVVHVCSRALPRQGTVIPTASEDPSSPLEQTSEAQAFLTDMIQATEDKVPNFLDAIENLLLDSAVRAR